jgi:hypothetical protein
MSNTMIDGDDISGAGIDLPRSRRPGSPMESALRAAAGAHWEAVERQPVTGEILKRADRQALTPVFGTAQQPHGLSGVLRRYAYTIPDHKPRHWALLFLADRVDVVESAAGEAFQRRPVATSAGVVLVVGAAMALWLGADRRRSRSPWRRLLRAS